MGSKTIIQVETRTYSLKGNAKTINPKQEFINRAIIFEQSYAEALSNQLFHGSGTKIMNCINWCKHYDMMDKVGLGITNNMHLDTIESGEIEYFDKEDFLPIAWLRVNNAPVNSNTYPSYFSNFLSKYFKRLFDDRHTLSDLMKNIASSPTISDIDKGIMPEDTTRTIDIFFIVGMPLNRSEPYCIAYYYSFFEELITKNAEMKDHATYLRYYVGDDTYYDNLGRYAEINGEKYYALNDIINGRSVAYCTGSSQLGLNKFTQLSVYWDRIFYESGLSGNLGKDGYRMDCVYETKTSYTNSYEAKIGIIKNTVHESHEREGGGWYSYDYDVYHYVVYKESVYVGDYFVSYEVETTDSDGHKETKTNYARLDVFSDYQDLHRTGWFSLSEDAIQDLRNRGILCNANTRRPGYSVQASDYLNAVDRNYVIGSTNRSEPVNTVNKFNYKDKYDVYHPGLLIGMFSSSNQAVYGIASGEITVNEVIYTRPREYTTITIDKQRKGDNSTYDRIIVTNLFYVNSMLFGGRLKSFNAREGRYWDNNDNQGHCPFILPVYRPAFERLSVIERNGASQFMFNIVFNITDIQEIEYDDWWGSGFFGIIVTIVAIVITVVAVVAQQYYVAGATAGITTGVSVGTQIATTIINIVVKAIVAAVVQMVVAKLLTAITGNEMIGNIVGVIAGAIAGSMVSYGANGLSFSKFSLSASNITKICGKALLSTPQNILKYQQNQYQLEAEQFQNEVNQWSSNMEEIAKSNQAMIAKYMPDPTEFNQLLEYKLWKYMCDPYVSDNFSYLGSDFSTAIDVEQRFVYNFAEDSIKLPDNIIY